MAEVVAGPEIKTIKEHQFVAKKKHTQKLQNTKHQNQFRQALLCH